MATTIAQRVPAELPTRAEMEEALELLHGHWHVGDDDYFASEDDAARARRAVAERMQRDMQRGITSEHAARALEVRRLARDGQTACVWCGRPFLARDGVVALAGRLMHEAPCGGEFDAFTSDSPRTGQRIAS